MPRPVHPYTGACTPTPSNRKGCTRPENRRLDTNRQINLQIKLICCIVFEELNVWSHRED